MSKGLLFSGHSVDTALLEWVSEYAVRAYTTPDGAVSYLYSTLRDCIGYTIVCFMMHDCS